MRAVVCIPWRTSLRNDERVRNFAYVMSWWQWHDFAVVVADGDNDDGTFNISKARNRAAEVAAADFDADVLVFADADTLPGGAITQPILTARQQVLDAADAARRTPGVIYPHDHYWSLTREASAKRLAMHPMLDSTLGVADAPPPNRVSVSGLVVCSVDSWRALGGWDERFTGWGNEDVAFAILARDVLGRALRTRGHVLHLWHERDSYTQSTAARDHELIDRYRQAALVGPHALRALRGLP